MRTAAPGPRDWAPLVAVLALFLFAGSRALDLPGLWPDEASDAVLGMEVALDLPRSPSDWRVELGGRSYPLRTRHPYDFSAFNIYASALAFELGGVSVAVLRFSALLVCAAGLAALCALALPALGAAGAFAAALLLALQPAYLLHARLGYFAAETFLVLPGCAALALAFGWRRTRRPAALCAAAFVLGASLNITTKALALVCAYPPLFWALLPRPERPSRRLLAAAAACGALGAANFILFNATHGLEIGRSLLEALAAPTPAGVDNAAWGANLLTRLGQLGSLFAGRVPAGLAGEVTSDRLFTPFLLASAAALAWRVRRERDFAGRPLASFALLAAPALLALTAFTPMGLDHQHLLVLWPCLAVIGAAALTWLRERRGTAAAVVALGLVVLSSARTDAAFYKRLGESGGLADWSDAVYAVAAALDREGAREPVALEWGFPQSVYLLTKGRVRPVGLGGHRRRAVERGFATLERRALEPGAYFISAAGDASEVGALYHERLRAVVAKAKRRLVLVHEAADRAGRPRYRVWKVAP